METVNQETEVRTFTQDEVNAIVGDRVKREREKYADYEDLRTKAAAFDEAEEARKTELQKATERAEALQSQLDAMNQANAVRDARAEAAQKTGVPVELLTGNDLETCIQQANGILAFSQKNSYPSVTDGGETSTPAVTKKEILGIQSDKARLQAIKDNIELFS